MKNHRQPSGADAQSQPPQGRGGDDFDRAMRELHAQALASISPRTQARLRVARTAARAPESGQGRVFGWVLASGFAGLFALAIGTQLSGPSSTVAPVLTASTDDARYGSNSGGGEAFATLDENPDFYLWLASNDKAMPTGREQSR